MCSRIKKQQMTIYYKQPSIIIIIIIKDISQSVALEVRPVYKMTGGWSEMSSQMMDLTKEKPCQYVSCQSTII